MVFDFNPPIAVLDSGIGGLKIAKVLSVNFPSEDIIYFADSKYIPYGKKTKKGLLKRLELLTDFLINNFNIKMLVLACNTATVIGLEHLKNKFKIPVFGVLPSVNGTDLIICTSLTKNASKNEKFIAIPYLASNIENDYFDDFKLKKIITKIGDKYNFNVKSITLGCTHYELKYNIFKRCYPNVNFICPTHETIKQVIDCNLLQNKPNLIGQVYIMSSLPSKANIDKLYKIFKELDVPSLFTR